MNPDVPAKIEDNKVQILPIPHKQDGNVTYICLIEDFYPNVIKVIWEGGETNAEENAVVGEIWPSGDNENSYSVSSWLTIDKRHSKNYNCSYQHETGSKTFPIESQDSSAKIQTTGACINNSETSTSIATERFVHRTAYLVYIVLLLKSTMYYFIILFFMYRMTPSKRRGKKP